MYPKTGNRVHKSFDEVVQILHMLKYRRNEFQEDGKRNHKGHCEVWW